MKKINNTLADKDVYELFDKVKQQLTTNWIYLHFDVLKSLEKYKCFEGYETQKQLNGDGSCTQLIKGTFKKDQEERLSIYIENCKLGEYSYYIIHSIEIGQENIFPTPNPKGAIFLNNLSKKL